MRRIEIHVYLCHSQPKRRRGQDNDGTQSGSQLARNAEKRVLLLDLDAQGNLSDACGLDPQTLERTVFDVLAGNASIAEAKSTLEAGLDISRPTSGLQKRNWPCRTNGEGESAEESSLLCFGRIRLRADRLPAFSRAFDRQRPQCGKRITHPVQVEYYALAGLALIRQTAELVRALNPDLAILGLVLTFFDARKTLNKDVAAALADEWGDTLFSTRIRDNVSLAEAPSNGRMCSATNGAVTAQKTMRPLLPNFWKERRDAMGLGIEERTR